MEEEKKACTVGDKNNKDMSNSEEDSGDENTLSEISDGSYVPREY